MDDLNKCLKDWLRAKSRAGGNTALLLGEWSSEKADECAKRMNNVALSEKALLQFENKDDLPFVLTNFFATRRGAMDVCGPCWISSKPRSALHPECGKSIEKYFSSEKALLEYVRELQ